MDNNVNKDWNQPGTWAEELVEQAKEQTVQAERNTKRWFVTWLITMAILFVTNAAWLYVFQSYDYVTQYSDGINSINTGTQGDIINEPNGKN